MNKPLSANNVSTKGLERSNKKRLQHAIKDEFGGERLSDRGEVSNYITRNSPVLKNKIAGRKSCKAKARKVARVMDDKPDWGMAMPKFPSALIGLMLLMVVGTAHADSIKVDGGYADVISSKYDDAWVASVRYEKPVLTNRLGTLALAGEYHHVGKSYHPTSGWLSGNGLLAELIYRPLKGKWDPYLFGGAGYYIWDWTNSESTDAAGIEVELGEPGEVGYKGGIGLDYHLDAHWAINVEAYYYGSEYSLETYNPDGSHAHYIGDQTVGNEGVCGVLGIRYDF